MELLAILPAYLHSYNSRMARNSRNLEFPGPGDPCGPDGSGDPVAGLVVFKMFSLVLLAISVCSWMSAFLLLLAVKTTGMFNYILFKVLSVHLYLAYDNFIF